MSQDALIRDLVEWSSQNGGFCDPRVQIYSDPITGLSFGAAEAIPSGTEFMKCSFRATLSYLNTLEISSSFQRHDSQPFPESFIAAFQDDEPFIISHFFLIQQYLLKEKSYWWPYIRLLPQPDEPEKLAIPALWPETDQKFFMGTNVERAIQERKELWEVQFSRAIHLLWKEFDVSSYSPTLYQWAATIFGTRSFRPSATISAVLFQEASKTSNFDLLRIRQNIRNDKFSILLPLVDIGNHNGVEMVKWISDPVAGSISLKNFGFIKQGDQIYNYYGDKTNTELLVGYGFVVDQKLLNCVNMRMTPPPKALQLRRLQRSHPRIRQEGPSTKEFLYRVTTPLNTRLTYDRLDQIDQISSGWFDTLSCTLANRRETSFLASNPNYSLETDANIYRGPMYRNVIAVLVISSQKLETDAMRISSFEGVLPSPTNHNQSMAQNYRKNQYTLLLQALSTIQRLLFSVALYGIVRRADGLDTATPVSSVVANIELLSLENAYHWLPQNHPALYDTIIAMILDDQIEKAPLDWANMIEKELDQLYWSVWIFVISLFHTMGKNHLPQPKLVKWIDYMERVWNDEMEKDKTVETLDGEISEDTENWIRHTCDRIFELPYFAELDESEFEDHLNFSRFVAIEEVVTMPYLMQAGKLAGKLVDQKILCLSYALDHDDLSPERPLVSSS